MDDFEAFRLSCQGAEHNEPFKHIRIRNISDFATPKNLKGAFPDICTSDYDSPIKIIASQIQTEMDNQVLRAVQQVDIQVDKDELVKALNYDRQQYDKGFRVGYDKGYSDGVDYALSKMQEILKGGDDK